MIPVVPGTRFGHLVVLREVERGPYQHRMVEYRCDCGKIGRRIVSKLPRAVVCSRQCILLKSPTILPGTRFGHLVVLRGVEPNAHRCRMAEYRCDCGKIGRRELSSLPHAATCSHQCCLARATLSERKRTHGMRKHPLYRVWVQMVSRCTNPNHPNWTNYGGRGIEVCREWRNFEDFFRDMSPGYTKGLFIDRIDNDRGYSKENCRWLTHRESNRNKRNKVTPDWILDTAAANGISAGAVYARVKRGWDLRQACTEPVRTKYRNSKSHSLDSPQPAPLSQR